MLAIAAILLFWDLGGRPLYAPDEGRYAAIGLEMARSGDWIVPRLNGIPYLDKPPLLYWLEALGIVLIGRGEWGVRLLPALAAWLAVPLAMRLGREMYDRETGIASGAVLASCAQWIGVGRALLTDGILSVALLGAFLCFWRVCEGRSGALGLWLSLALATLAKGPIGPALFGLAVVLFWLLADRRPSLTRLRPALGLLLYLGVSTPWFVWIERQIPGYAAYFFLNQNLEALVSPEVHHGAPWYHAFALVGAGFAPWSALLPLALSRVRRLVGPGRERLSRPTLLLCCWAGATLVIFTFSVSKLITYYLPMYPALALLVARLLLRGGVERAAAAALCGLAVLAAAAGGIALAAFLPGGPTAALSLCVIAVSAGIGAAGILVARAKPLSGLLALSSGFAIAVLFAVQDLYPFDANRSTRALLEASREAVAACDVVVAVRFPPGMVEFYLDRRVVLVDTPHDYAAGRTLDPDAGEFVAGSDLPAFFEVHPRACILSKLDRAEQMLGANDRLRVARRSARFALLTLDGPAG